MAETEIKRAADEKSTEEKNSSSTSASGKDSSSNGPSKSSSNNSSNNSSKSSSKSSSKGSSKGSSKRPSKSASGKKSAPGGRSSSADRSKKADTRSRSGARRRSGRASAAARQPLAESFSHAFDGIMAGVEERNMKIHFGFVLLVLIFGLLLQISATEWCICFTLFGLVLSLEQVNTAVEAVVDLVTEEYKPLAKTAKDAAAGAVLIAAIMAAVTGLIIFIPRLLFALRIL